MNRRKSKLSGIGFLLKIKKRSKGVGYNPLNFFKRFIENALIDAKSNNAVPSGNNENIENLLIDEIQKKEGFEKKKKKEVKKNMSEEKKQIYNYFMSLPSRNIDTIIFCLNRLKKFNEFIKFNKLSYDQLEKLAAYIKLQFVPKNQLLFSMGKKARRFFCIINGCISLRTVDPIRVEEEKLKNFDIQIEENYEEEFLDNNKENDKLLNLNSKENFIGNNGENYSKEIKEFEIRKYTQGMCLCEWDLIKKRTLIDNAYAIEDTNVFYLEKEYFDKILSNQISRSDIERKYFITMRIPILNLDNLSNVQPEFYNKGNIIYTEFDKAKEAILIYKGSAAITVLKNAKKKREIYERRKELKIITKVERGGLAGLEIGKINNENEDIFYDNTLIITDNNTIIFRLNINNLKGKSQKLGRALKKFFNELYLQQNDFINNLKIQSQKKYKLNKEISDEEKIMCNLNKLFDSLSNEKVELKESKVRNQIMLNHLNTEQDNNNKNIKIKRNERCNTLLEMKYNSKSTEHSSKNFFSNEKYNKKQINLNILNDFKCNKLILKRNHEDLMIKNPTHSNNIILKYNTFFKNIPCKKDCENNYNDEEKKNNNNSNIKLFSMSSNKSKKSINSFKNNDFLKYKFKINKSIETSPLNHIYKINNKSQKNYNNTNKYYYDSGNFKIPLLSLNIMK